MFKGWRVFTFRRNRCSTSPEYADLVLNQIVNGNYLLFSHHQQVNFGVLKLLAAYPFIRNAQWLLDFSTPSQYQSISDLIYMGLDLSDKIGFRDHFAQQVVNAGSFAALKASLKRLLNLVEKVATSSKSIKFPVAPLLGNNHIESVNTMLDLYDLGQSQKNCIFDYLEDIVSGAYFVYRVKGRVTATLGVDIKEDGIVFVDQLLAACNQAVDSDTNQMVKLWFQNSSVMHDKVKNHRFLSEYKSRQHDNAMSEYHAYSSQPVQKQSHLRHTVEYKKNQLDKISSDYAEYSVSFCNAAPIDAI